MASDRLIHPKPPPGSYESSKYNTIITRTDSDSRPAYKHSLLGLYEAPSEAPYAHNPAIYRADSSSGPVYNVGVDRTSSSGRQVYDIGVGRTSSGAYPVHNNLSGRTQSSSRQVYDSGIGRTRSGAYPVYNNLIWRTESSSRQVHDIGVGRVHSAARPVYNTGTGFSLRPLSYDYEEYGNPDEPELFKFSRSQLGRVGTDFTNCTEPWALSSIASWLQSKFDGWYFTSIVTDALVDMFLCQALDLGFPEASVIAYDVVLKLVGQGVLRQEDSWTEVGPGTASGVIIQLTNDGCYASTLHRYRMAGRCYSSRCQQEAELVNYHVSIPDVSTNKFFATEATVTAKEEDHQALAGLNAMAISNNIEQPQKGNADTASKLNLPGAGEVELSEVERDAASSQVLLKSEAIKSKLHSSLSQRFSSRKEAMDVLETINYNLLFWEPLALATIHDYERSYEKHLALTLDREVGKIELVRRQLTSMRSKLALRKSGYAEGNAHLEQVHRSINRASNCSLDLRSHFQLRKESASGSRLEWIQKDHKLAADAIGTILGSLVDLRQAVERQILRYG